ncbi:hypothetical protein EM595_p0085 (plasmid) [Duffyella gerundensis]|uniref:Uncharacterized protein n=1 Tax=Duffyella gerundensis TaxID=1619313 RepID=A0A0U5L4Q4_9GAMM|nr:hypothetical protein EM595_p0085 [Duffyella gerundensis]
MFKPLSVSFCHRFYINALTMPRAGTAPLFPYRPDAFFIYLIGGHCRERSAIM